MKFFLQIFFCGVITYNSFCFQLDRVILATNDNPDYIQFWPLAAKLWTEIVGVRPTLALIGDSSVEVDETLGDVLRFKPIKGVPTSRYAQCIRLLLPCLFPNDMCIVSDIDLLPLQNEFYTKNVQKFADDAFVVYRDLHYYSWYSYYFIKKKRYYMNYIAAKGSTFQEIFGVTNADQFSDIIKNWQTHGFGWDTDEKVMYLLIKKWKKNNKGRFKKTRLR